ncbi:hypothetical protein ACFW1A_31040 [Kitasatospora sp. NPDC058965]|uniref:hypothetical protein n=1 Tax=Kitasatospora sp. NPDC058965 TaxID=3346682 RepID=UPI00367BC780
MADNPEPRRTQLSEPLARFQDALRSITAHRRAPLAAAHHIDRVGSPADIRVALGLLAEHPSVVLRMEEAARPDYVHPTRPLERSASVAALPVGGSLTLALSSLHADGRIRAQTVRPLLERLRQDPPQLGLVAFLVLRTTDWVPEVRDAARAALVLVLQEAPDGLVEAAAQVAVLLSRRKRGGFAGQQARAALLARPGAAHLERLLGSPDHLLRQFALQVAVSGGRCTTERLAALARDDADRRVRELAAEAAVREAVWADRLDLVRRLAADRHPEVRAAAVTGLLRAGRTADAARFFDDLSPEVRAVAHEAVGRVGGDVPAHYRTAVREARPTPGAILGLADFRDRTDAAGLTELLSHPHADVRAAALRALRQLRAVPAESARLLLGDPSRRVVREAVRVVPAEAELLSHPRGQVRAAALRALLSLGAVPGESVLPFLRDPSRSVVRVAARSLSPGARAPFLGERPGLIRRELSDRP